MITAADRFCVQHFCINRAQFIELRYLGRCHITCCLVVVDDNKLVFILAAWSCLLHVRRTPAFLGFVTKVGGVV